jgi:hypothetical protein
MKCTICKNEYSDIHEIQHGEKTMYMCAQSWNYWLADLDGNADASLASNYCPDEKVNNAS